MRGRIWRAGWIGLGLVMGSASPGHAQGLLPPTPGASLDQLSRRMAESVRDLGEDVAAGIGPNPAGQYLTRDVQELGRAAGEWYESTRGATDPHQLRRSYSGIDVSWHRLRAQLAAPGVANPAISEEIGRVDRADAAIHQALNLNVFPESLEGGTAAPSGVDEARRLAYALAQRGEALASTIQGVYGPNPAAASLINDSADVARTADGFSDLLNSTNGAPPPDQARQAFVPIVQKSNGVGITLGTAPMPPPVKAAWDNYTTALNLLRANLGLSNVNIDFPSQPAAPSAIPFNPNPTGQVAQWAETLDRQVDDLIGNFAPTVGAVPEGRELLGEMERLRADVRDFRGDAARGLDPNRLAYEFREVDADWQRLARRVNRITRGRTGPNIQRVQQVGQTCQQIHQALGMPGYAPTLPTY